MFSMQENAEWGLQSTRKQPQFHTIAAPYVFNRRFRIFEFHPNLQVYCRTNLQDSRSFTGDLPHLILNNVFLGSIIIINTLTLIEAAQIPSLHLGIMCFGRSQSEY